MSNLLLKRHLAVEMYGSSVTLYISRNAAKTVSRVAAIRKIPQNGSSLAAWTGSDGNNGFYLIFQLGQISKNAVTHEVRHCADFIMDHIGHKNCRHCSNEPFAYLAGYLQNWVELELARAGIPIIVQKFGRAKKFKNKCLPQSEV